MRSAGDVILLALAAPLAALGVVLLALWLAVVLLAFTAVSPVLCLLVWLALRAEPSIRPEGAR